MHPIDWTPSSDSRLWIYTADRALTQSEQADFLSECSVFLDDWTAHGADLKAEAVVLLDRIFVVALDLDCAPATGCSIDRLMSFVREHGVRTGIDWFDRHQVVFWENENVQAPCQQLRTPEFWARRKAGIVDDSTMVCDPLITSGAEWGEFVKSFSSSWHAQMWD